MKKRVTNAHPQPSINPRVTSQALAPSCPSRKVSRMYNANGAKSNPASGVSTKDAAKAVISAMMIPRHDAPACRALPPMNKLSAPVAKIVRIETGTKNQAERLSNPVTSA